MKRYTYMLITLLAALMITACGSQNQNTPKTQGHGNGNGTPPTVELDNYPKSDLTDAQKHALAYMWHEEKLAYEIYLELNKVHPAKQFVNIATKSEILHMNLVKDLVEKYDINITNLVDFTVEYSEDELLNMEVAQFAVPEVQSLYDTLYAIGIQSPQKAIEVACMVEVTDVDDLDRYIEVSSISNARDYQSRRGNIKYKPNDGSKSKYIHMLNGSGLATSRLMVAILETYQNKDGSLTVPEVLRPFVGIDVIK